MIPVSFNRSVEEMREQIERLEKRVTGLAYTCVLNSLASIAIVAAMAIRRKR